MTSYSSFAYGGAICNLSGVLLIEGCVFENCQVEAQVEVRADGVFVTANGGSYGGAVYGSGLGDRIMSSQFLNNRADSNVRSYGGAEYNMPIISNSDIF